MAIEAAKTGYSGVEIHGNSIRVVFMYKGVRHRHTLGLELTKNNIKHAAGLRSAALFALKTGKYNEADSFLHSRSPDSSAHKSKRLGDLCERYKPLKAVGISPETQSRYEKALNVCLETIGRDRPAHTLLPADIQQLRVDLIATRAVSTVNHYLATFAGFLYWCARGGRFASLAESPRITYRRCAGAAIPEDAGPKEGRQRLVRAECLEHQVGQSDPSRGDPPAPAYQTRHTYACWNLTARGNLAFIANQMGHNDYSMLVKVYGRWIDSESPRELERIWAGLKNMAGSVPNLPQKLAA